MLKVNYEYRLALSATLDRHGDESGTKKLYDFFGKKCITYDLGRAIIERKLTPYYYYPILVTLDDDELIDYQQLTEKIRKFHYQDNGNDMPDGLKKLLIKRARLIAKAKNKVFEFENKILNYKNDSNIIVYCGAVKYDEHDFDDCNEDKKQIEIIKDSMNKKFNMVATKFTAEEDVVERQAIINSFKLEEIQALVAIKCLDEGMNIPAIKTAFILASSTNPKEYIQRRGRVLRRSEGKKFATIYDLSLIHIFGIDEIISSKKHKLLKKQLSQTNINASEFILFTLPKVFNTNEFDKLVDQFAKLKSVLDKYCQDYLLVLKASINSYLGFDDKTTLTQSLNYWLSKNNKVLSKTVLEPYEKEFINVCNTSQNDNELTLINKVAYCFTSLFIEDWSNDTYDLFEQQLQKISHLTDANNENDGQNSISITVDGETIVKRFNNEDNDAFELIENFIDGTIEDYGDLLNNEQKIALLVRIMKKYL